MQGVAIRAAKNLNCYVVAVDANRNAASVDLADRFEPIDLKDYQALIAFALQLKAERGLDAVFTVATDFSFSVAKVAEACGLHGHSVQSAENATDKAKMRECFDACGVPSTKFVRFGDAEAKAAVSYFTDSNLKLPVVVKPVDNMGARGCEKVCNLSDLKQAVENSIKYSRTGYAIVEEFIEGNEFSLEGLVFNGELFITAVAQRHIAFPPYFVEMGHTIPANISSEDAFELIKVFSDGVKALGLTSGAVKGDIFLKDSKAYVGEIAARLSGGYMSGWTVPYSSGIDITTAAIKLALGQTPVEIISCADAKKLPPLFQNTKKFSAERAWISIPGVIEKVYGLQEAKNTLGVCDVFPRNKKGDKVKFPENNVEKCGNVLSVGKTYNDAVMSAEKACKKIVLRLMPANNATDDFLKQTNNSFPPDFINLALSEKKSILDSVKDCRHIKKEKIVFPCVFEKYLNSAKDIQGRTLTEVFELLYTIEPALLQWVLNLPDLHDNRNSKNMQRDFWSAFIRGGIQGALYFYDTQTLT
ncbi:MAG: hypothetical protein CR988_01060 [Treponema sp.]|nr:MAG: hypothetical protein CR988_01060 [Treponema sp.]